MRKILLILSLSLPFIFAGCGSGGSATCTSPALTAGATYRVYYTRPVYPTDIILTKVADSTGHITTPTYGYPCGALLYVLVTNANVPLSASPSSVYLPTPPSTTTITGQGFDATYGMPEVDYFDGNGYLVGAVYANSVSSDGTSLQANVPDLSGVYTGTYQVKVTNKTSGGYYANIVGSATMAGWGRDRVDSDGDGWYDDEDCDPYDPSRNYSCTETCGGYDNVPRTVCEPMY